jgi:hypothetical protein
MWLEANDELLPGRAARLIGRLDAEEGDLAFDEIDLHDGITGAFVRRIEMPPFIGGRRQIVRLFERNYLPGPGVPAFRSSTAQRIGFDPALHGSEDFDFVLRAIVENASIVLVRQVGYRQFAYPATLSKNFDNQLSMTRDALRKHDPALVQQLFTRAGYHGRTIAWGMVAFLTMRGDYARAVVAGHAAAGIATGVSPRNPACGARPARRGARPAPAGLRRGWSSRVAQQLRGRPRRAWSNG